MATGAGAMSITSSGSASLSGRVVITTPGLGGGGGGGGATVGGQPGGPWQITAHWSTHDVTVESPSGPGPPAGGQPKPPVPLTKQGPAGALLRAVLGLVRQPHAL